MSNCNALSPPLLLLVPTQGSKVLRLNITALPASCVAGLAQGCTIIGLPSVGAVCPLHNMAHVLLPATPIKVCNKRGIYGTGRLLTGPCGCSLRSSMSISTAARSTRCKCPLATGPG